VAQPARSHRARRLRLDQEVRLLDQAQEEFLAAGTVEVAGDAALAARVGRPVQRLLARRSFAIQRREAAGRRAGGRLDLEDVGAELR
jgi:hypothetical protein